jgi:hypothetical protein
VSPGVRIVTAVTPPQQISQAHCTHDTTKSVSSDTVSSLKKLLLFSLEPNPTFPIAFCLSLPLSLSLSRYSCVSVTLSVVLSLFLFLKIQKRSLINLGFCTLFFFIFFLFWWKILGVSDGGE